MNIVRSIASKGKKLAAGAVAVGAATLAHAQATVESVVTSAGAITGTATTQYVAAAALGVGVLSVGVIVYMAKRGWKLR
jgi:hypothetical protein